MATKPRTREGALVQVAFDRMKERNRRASWRSISKELGISDTRLRQYRDGWQGKEGAETPVTMTSAMLADIAEVMKISPAELTDVDRTDAAALLMAPRDSRERGGSLRIGVGAAVDQLRKGADPLQVADFLETLVRGSRNHHAG